MYILHKLLFFSELFLKVNPLLSHTSTAVLFFTAFGWWGCSRIYLRILDVLIWVFTYTICNMLADTHNGQTYTALTQTHVTHENRYSYRYVVTSLFLLSLYSDFALCSEWRFSWLPQSNYHFDGTFWSDPQCDCWYALPTNKQFYPQRSEWELYYNT